MASEISSYACGNSEAELSENSEAELSEISDVNKVCRKISNILNLINSQDAEEIRKCFETENKTISTATLKDQTFKKAEKNMPEKPRPMNLDGPKCQKSPKIHMAAPLTPECCYHADKSHSRHNSTGVITKELYEKCFMNGNQDLNKPLESNKKLYEDSIKKSYMLTDKLHFSTDMQKKMINHIKSQGDKIDLLKKRNSTNSKQISGLQGNIQALSKELSALKSKSITPVKSSVSEKPKGKPRKCGNESSLFHDNYKDAYKGSNQPQNPCSNAKLSDGKSTFEEFKLKNNQDKSKGVSPVQNQNEMNHESSSKDKLDLDPIQNFEANMELDQSGKSIKENENYSQETKLQPNLPDENYRDQSFNQRGEVNHYEAEMRLKSPQNLRPNDYELDESDNEELKIHNISNESLPDSTEKMVNLIIRYQRYIEKIEHSLNSKTRDLAYQEKVISNLQNEKQHMKKLFAYISKRCAGLNSELDQSKIKQKEYEKLLYSTQSFKNLVESNIEEQKSMNRIKCSQKHPSLITHLNEREIETLLRSIDFNTSEAKNFHAKRNH